MHFEFWVYWVYIGIVVRFWCQSLRLKEAYTILRGEIHLDHRGRFSTPVVEEIKPECKQGQRILFW